MYICTYVYEYLGKCGIPRTQVQKGEHNDEPKDFVYALHAEPKDLGVPFF